MKAYVIINGKRHPTGPARISWCECADHQCPAHPGRDCNQPSTMTLGRINFAGTPSVRACDACGEDMMESGVFG